MFQLNARLISHEHTFPSLLINKTHATKIQKDLQIIKSTSLQI